MRLFTLAAAGGLWLTLCLSAAADESVLKGKVLDLDGRPVPGVKLFLYDSANARRPADFISVPSGADGRIGIAVPAGKYWTVAREKKEQGYGPLARGDRHSGEPVELELPPGTELECDFVVADIQEVRERKRLVTPELFRIKGRILDQKGAPVQDAYVYARENKQTETVPMFLSAATDADGAYQLDLPHGVTYFVAASRQFPPEKGAVDYREIAPPDKQDLALDMQISIQ